MKKALKYIGLALLAGVLILAALASGQPDEFRVTRSALVPAPSDSVAALITDFRRWSVWSPYEAMDPQMKRSYAGTAAGVGAVYTWEGDQVGSGRMEITGVTPAEVTIALDFTAPFEAHNIATFSLEPEGEGTRVTWTMAGKNSFIGKVMHVVFDMDRMVGKDFETGLQNMGRALGR